MKSILLGETFNDTLCGCAVIIHFVEADRITSEDLELEMKWLFSHKFAVFAAMLHPLAVMRNQTAWNARKNQTHVFSFHLNIGFHWDPLEFVWNKIFFYFQNCVPFQIQTLINVEQKQHGQ